MLEVRNLDGVVENDLTAGADQAIPEFNIFNARAAMFFVEAAMLKIKSRLS